ncbi:O-antigen ligase family protein [Photobacterium sp. TY1-4]|uniref:O-antigen ligase family protein n=1 Tax=Photobacterium sp. TY1-4 TaxID=2899122 RepID=UPI0021C03061|nr:O-antigen ligase family protein [Photobacterium sp. TY1-4]UXI01456.1 O-antigen ligase family protein [Photobacterium sp. TY1-4]
MNVTVIEKALIAFFGLSLFTSKAGLNISVGLLLLYFICACFNNREYRQQIVQCKVFMLAIGLYFVGLLSTILYPTTGPDTAYFARKAAFLLAIPCLFLLNRKPENKRVAIYAMIISFILAALLALYHALSLEHWQEERISSFLDVGRWSEILTYFLVFTLPIALDHKERQTKRFFLIALLIIGYVCLILSGSRGAMLTTFGISTLFLLALNRRVLYRVAVASLVILPLLVVIFPTKATLIQERVASIVNTNDESNSARLTMWQTGASFAANNLQQNPMAFFFGSGPLNFEHEFKSFTIDRNNNTDITQTQIFSYTDTHNGILDASLKLGVIYESLFIVLIALIARAMLRATPNIKYSGLCVIAAFFSIGMFYTNQLEYQTICFFYFLSISLSHIREHHDA